MSPLDCNDIVSILFWFCIGQQHLEPPEHLPGLSDDVGAGFIAGHGSQSASVPAVDVEHLVDVPPVEEFSGMGLSKVIRADQKRFFFDLGSNNRGHYLRISEVSCSCLSPVILIALPMYQSKTPSFLFDAGRWSWSFVYNIAAFWFEAVPWDGGTLCRYNEGQTWRNDWRECAHCRAQSEMIS